MKIIFLKEALHRALHRKKYFAENIKIERDHETNHILHVNDLLIAILLLLYMMIKTKSATI